MLIELPPGHRLRRPALFWLWLHVPLLLAIYGPALLGPLLAVPGTYRLAVAASYLVQAAMLMTLLYLITWPLSLRPRAYSIAVPLLAGLAMAAALADSQVYRATGFHLNGLLLRVLQAPSALRELGIPAGGPLVLGLLAAAFAVAEVAVGRRFLLRFATEKPAARWAGAVLGLVLVERFASAALIFDGGFSVDVAEQVLPLQPPMRLDGQMSYLSGHSARVDPRRAGAPLPPVSGLREIDPSSVRFTRKPDVLLVLIESLRADFLDPETMPRLWTRARHGAVFERHYAAATSTAHSMFGLLYGLNSYKYQAVLGSGRSPLLLGALQANGYRSHFIAASAVKWIESGSSPVFRNTPGQLESDLVGDGESRDADMLARARRFMTTGGAQPQFLFLFFVGTHFRYSFPPRSARFQPYWDGGGPPRDPARVRARARNAAYEVDWKLDDFLDEYAAARGRKPLVIVTGDHGESLGERGRFGHGSDVSEAQIHVPMVLLDPSGPPSTWGGVTSHIDIVPTLLALLGDDHPPRSYADGVSMLAPPADRYVLTTVGWEPRHGLVGRDLKATFFGGDAGLLGVALTDPADRSLPDGNARLRAEAARIARTFRDSQAGR